jgi:hypothetical protein
MPISTSQQPIVAQILSLDDVSREYPGFSRSRLYRLSSQGRLEILKIGSRSVIRRGDIERLLDDAPRLHPRPVTKLANVTCADCSIDEGDEP